MDRLRIRSILESVGHETYSTEDPDQVLDYVAGGVEVVVTDLQMTRVHGLQLIMDVRTADPDVLIIAVSGTGEDQLDMAEAVGASLSLNKPVEPADLLGAIERFTEHGAG
jgi:CheY-like chemotaxis protein